MNLKLLSLLAATLLFPVVTLHAGSGDENLDAATKARIERFEKGPATVDVSAYPSKAKADYRVFREKCALCHKLSRPINSDYVLPSEWARYVKRMMFKPGSNISKLAAKKIYDFLVFDASVRKKTQLDEKLAKLSAADRAAEVAKIDEVRKEFGN